MTEALDTNQGGIDRDVAMADFAAGIRAVAKAGIEQGHVDLPAIDLPPETLTRAAEIYKAEALD